MFIFARVPTQRRVMGLMCPGTSPMPWGPGTFAAICEIARDHTCEFRCSRSQPQAQARVAPPPARFLGGVWSLPAWDEPALWLAI
jgi:hypothetical protein